jgi:hypothetical protein
MNVNGQERIKAQADIRARLLQQTEADDIKWLMNNKRGRRIARRLLDHAGVFNLSFNTTAMTMAFNEGRKNEGLRLLALVHEFCPEQYTLMMQESAKNDD